MKKPLFLIAISALLFTAFAANAAALRRPNFVVFNIRGDCHQEDCLYAIKDAMSEFKDSIVFLDATSLAEHQTMYYKTVTITFTDLKAAPYGPVMQKIAALGYDVISFVIHDTHTGQDTIIPH